MWAETYWSHTLTALGGVAIGYCGSGLFPSGFPLTKLITFWTGAVFFLLGTVSTVRQSVANATLRTRLAQFEAETAQFRGDYFARLDTFLRITAEGLRFGRTERITVYRQKQGRFIAIGRHSDNLAYCERRRPYYPSNQGCIARAWRDGAAFEPALPNPKKRLEDWCQAQQERWGIPAEDARKFNMKSRSLAAYVISNLGGTQRLGVVVFESERGNGLQKALLDTILPVEGRRIAHLIETLSPFEPDPDAASRQGY